MPIRLFICDDSAFIRSSLKRILRHPDIEIVGEAENGLEAVKLVQEIKPDLITMDIEMPKMNGIEATKIITSRFAIPVIMISSLTSEGATATVEALTVGAVDFITKKPALGLDNEFKNELIDKILEVGHSSQRLSTLHRLKVINEQKHNSRQIAKNEPDSKAVPTKPKEVLKSNHKGKYKLLIIGISTGGPSALQEVIPRLPANFPSPIIVIQHMPPFFTKSLAERLDSKSELSVKEIEDDEFLTNSMVYIGQGGKQFYINKSLKSKLVEEKPPGIVFSPCINLTLEKVNKYYGGSYVGVIMTGMGNDGRDGLLAGKKLGAYIIAQSPESCTIASMPKAVIEAGIHDEIVPLKDIAESICHAFGVNPL